MNCLYNETTVSCDAHQFACHDGLSCILDIFQCDSTEDCADGSDEGEQCGHSECGADKFRCSMTGRCIPLKFVCDGGTYCISQQSHRP